MHSLAQLLAGLLDRILAVVLAITAAQAPIYYAQYLQVLSGVRLEAEARYLELQREAQQLHMSVEAFVTRHEANADPAFQASGRIHRSTLSRYRQYDAAWQALSSASADQKPARLWRHFDPRIHAAVRFTPGLPLNREGLVWAGIGLLLAWLLASLGRWLLLPSPRSRNALR
ncbi:DUF2937 family protein [Stagnimonas aquatica]|uniref:DUF2937 family protein n=1 Tax=Stagnimonas aquatica TaxID=2689987 RepID=A0A3N0VEA8_9GAMM|nr:DUF2937 family protein [Stagnimonas aquatica]ROH91005.1 DUF2937 family protein [Stagnimonas aquatica]